MKVIDQLKGVNLRDRILFILSFFWIITFSIFATILLAIPLFALEMHGAHLAQVAQMSTHRLWKNFLVLMNYLLNPFVSQLKMPNFPSSASGLRHFRAVKHLFMLDLVIFVAFVPAFIIFLRENLHILFHRALKILLLFPVLAGIIVFMIGFDNFFIYFHEVLFRDKSWVFNPVTDPIINVLPEQYFMFTFIIFILIYEMCFLFLYWQEKGRNKNKNHPKKATISEQ